MAAHAPRPSDPAAEAAQMGRQHILMVNRAPALLDLVRVVLDGERYNVTTTNAVPRTFALIDATRPAPIIIDLALAESAGWALLVRLHAEATTAAIPVIVTATDSRLLDQARRYPAPFGGRRYLTVPFTVEALLRQVRALIGTADPGPYHVGTANTWRSAEEPRWQATRRWAHANRRSWPRGTSA